MSDIPFFTFADISGDQLYCWMLGRAFNRLGWTALWIGVNPSTADESEDDHSIRKLYGFGERIGISKWLIGNLFAYRATDVNELRNVQDPVGPLCDKFLKDRAIQADIVIAGWGNIGKIPKPFRYRVNEVAALIRQQGKDLWCWGTNQDGSPRHPLMVPYSQQLEVWS